MNHLAVSSRAMINAIMRANQEVGMDTAALRDWLLEILERETDRDGQDIEQEPLPTRLDRVQSYRDAGVWTALDGLVIRTEDGEEFQLTVVQSQYARRHRNG